MCWYYYDEFLSAFPEFIELDKDEIAFLSLELNFTMLEDQDPSIVARHLLSTSMKNWKLKIYG